MGDSISQGLREHEIFQRRFLRVRSQLASIRPQDVLIQCSQTVPQRPYLTILGTSRSEIPGTSCSDVLGTSQSEVSGTSLNQRAVTQGSPLEDVLRTLLRGHSRDVLGALCWISLNFILLFSPSYSIALIYLKAVRNSEAYLKPSWTSVILKLLNGF